jgi:hypothetical protein
MLVCLFNSKTASQYSSGFLFDKERKTKCE